MISTILHPISKRTLLFLKLLASLK
jgi:hypothetical protein